MTGRTVPLAIEGRQSEAGWFLEHGSLLFPPGPLPVTAGTHFDVVGHADSFKRDEEGNVTATVEALDGSPLPKDPDVKIALVGVEMTTRKEDSVSVIHRGRIAGVHFSGGPQW